MKKGRSEKAYMYGKNALAEALATVPHAIKKVHLAEGFSDGALIREIKRRNIPLATLSKNDAKQAVGAEASHQGVIAVIDTGALMRPYGEFIAALSVTDDTSLAVLGEIQDPHNVGAIIRSAAAFGVAGVLIPEHNQAQATGTVIKTSAGMAFRVPLVAIGNVNDTLRDLKKRGFWTYALAMEGSVPLASEKFEKPSVFVFGNEGGGVRAKTMETCDFALSIPMHPRAESLNVAVSAGIVFADWAGKHPKALEG